MRKIAFILLLLISLHTVSAESWVSFGVEYGHSESSIIENNLTKKMGAWGMFARLYDYSRFERMWYTTHLSILIPVSEEFEGDLNFSYSLKNAPIRTQLSLFFAPTLLIPLSSYALFYFGVGSDVHYINIKHHNEHLEEYDIGVGANLGFMTFLSDIGFLDVGVVADYNIAMYVSGTHYWGWGGDSYFGMYSLRPYIGFGIWSD